MGLIGLGAINSWEIRFRMSDTQIVIPMSGYGERFRRAGYDVPKPLIEVEEKPILAHVIDMFPNESNFLFICNQDHQDSRKYALEKTLNRYWQSCFHKWASHPYRLESDSRIDPSSISSLSYVVDQKLTR